MYDRVVAVLALVGVISIVHFGYTYGDEDYGHEVFCYAADRETAPQGYPWACYTHPAHFFMDRMSGSNVQQAWRGDGTISRDFWAKHRGDRIVAAQNRRKALRLLSSFN